jgi:hypothetical protein
MKKFILGVLIGALLIPVGVSAWNQRQMAQPIYGADCRHSTYNNTEEGKKKQAERPDDFDCAVTIFVFDDSGNKCYLAKGSNGTGLSCVKN